MFVYKLLVNSSFLGQSVEVNIYRNSYLFFPHMMINSVDIISCYMEDTILIM